MANCDMCGKIVERTQQVKVEDVVMNVCGQCTRYGTPLRQSTTTYSTNTTRSKQRRQRRLHPDENKRVKENAPQLLKQAREQQQLTQEQMAQKANIKESSYHKIESGHLALSLDMAKRLQKQIGIQLLEEQNASDEEEVEVRTKGEATPLTMGDLIKEQMKKK